MIRNIPPKIPLRFFRWYCRQELRDYIEGDLMELYSAWVKVSGKRRADLKFTVEVLLLFRPAIIRPVKKLNTINPYDMYKSYLMIAWRTFLKNKGYSGINILGLAVGLAACILIMLYVRHELSFDRFHEKADRIYRANNELKYGDNHLDLAVTNPIFGEVAMNEFPQIEQVTRLRWYGDILVKKGDENIREGNVAWADSTLFDVFTLPMISGDPKTALTQPNSIVVTESVARKYFDKTDVVGMTLTINNTQSRKITGVIRDIPSNSHFRFNSFIPMVEDEFSREVIWAGSQNWTTYLLLSPGVDVSALVAGLNQMMDRNLGSELQSLINLSLEEFTNQGNFFRVSLTRLTDIHLFSNKTGELYGSGRIEYVYIFSVTALFILLIACINFMNLATARSANRAREVGVRKVMGSFRTNLVQQFMTESFLTCTLAMLVAIGMSSLCLPYFNLLTGKDIDSNFMFTGSTIAGLIVLIIVVGILAGSYPAFYLSGFKPIAVLKGSKGTQVRKSLFRNTLVIFQFTASIVLIAGTIVVYRQMEYIRNKDLGYDRSQILIISNTEYLGQRMETFRNNLLQLNGVEKATVSGFLPVNPQRYSETFFSSPALDVEYSISIQKWTVDEEYIPTMGMELMDGRNFSGNLPGDSTAIILNESAARFLGNENIINKRLYQVMDREEQSLSEYHVVGIVKDFNFSSLREYVKPLALTYGTDRGNLNLKVNTANLTSLLSKIEREWSTLGLGLPFEYSFMDDDFNRQYIGERQVGKLLTVFAFLSILISCLGLLGLATFIAEQRTKEVGIRKVLGASVPAMVTLLSRDFLKLVLLSILFASPVAYYIMSQWLQEFAYRVNMSWWVFAVSGVIAIVIAVITVSFQAIKAAMANPVDSLRSE